MIINNPYIVNCESSTFSVLFDYFNWKKEIKLIHGLMQYPDWQPGINLLNYVKNIDQLRSDPNTYFVFDASTEGFSPFKNFFFHNLYESCRLHNVNPEKIIFVSTNMKDPVNLERYNRDNNIQNSLKVFCFLSFKKMIQDMVEDTYGFDFDSNTAFAHFQKQAKAQYNSVYGLSLSRVNREHRSLAHYLLKSSNLDKYFDISQDFLSEQEVFHTSKHFCLGQKFVDWARTLPLTIDTEDFETNHALALNSHLHDSTLFQIVNETHVKDWHGTSMFFSEKTFRPIAHMQPFVIFGQRGCNRFLEQKGFKLFHESFDYAFDDIYDTKKRYLAIIDTCEDLINRLKKMSKQEQIAWRFNQEIILKHNFDLLMNIDYYKLDFKKLIGTL